MSRFQCLFVTVFVLTGVAACASDDDAPATQTHASKSNQGSDAGADQDAAAAVQDGKTVLDLNDVSMHPEAYDWFDFKPNVEKLILAGDAASQHIAILWYTVMDGGVALHYHAKTESVYVIDGMQSDAKGTYATGTAYFNPPGSGHEIKDSSGFFLLAYAAPPDFMHTDLIGEYTPVRIDTRAADLTSTYAFEQQQSGVRRYVLPLDGMGGMSAQLLETSSSQAYTYRGNYLTVLDGSCEIDGAAQSQRMLVVTKAVEPEPFTLAASEGSTCLALGVSF